MKTEFISTHVKYTISFVDFCKAFNIHDAEGVDFINCKVDEKNEIITFEQIEPDHLLMVDRTTTKFYWEYE